MKDSPLNQAMKLPAGARLVRCALQVNPHGYATQYRGQPSKLTADAYNALLAEKCREFNIGAIAITNHNHVGDIDAITAALDAVGVAVFPGFEIGSSEGAHVLCLYEPGTTRSRLERYLGDLGIHDTDSNTKLSKYSFVDVLANVEQQGGLCIAAHATSESGGLLRVLKGEARINAWQRPQLLAIQIPGPVQDLPEDLRLIVQNKNPDYRRESAPAPDLAVAAVNAMDVNHPDDLANAAATTWIKMASVTLEGLKQAFLDPESRILLASDELEAPTERIEAVAWGGGFLADQALRLHENLNVLIGGRGTGKSTVIESLRFAFGLEPLGEEAREAHEQIVKSVLGGGARVWVRVFSQKPSPRAYIVERGVREAPVVKSDSGEVLNLRVADIIGGLQIYGQHEIAELTKDKVKQTALVQRFIESDVDFSQRKESVLRALQKNRNAMIETRRELDRIAEKLAQLPGIEETLKSFKSAGLEEKLKHQSLLIREERVLKSLDEKLDAFRDVAEILRENLPLDLTLVSEEALQDLPNHELLGRARAMLEAFGNDAESAQRALDQAIATAEAQTSELRAAWEGKRLESQKAYEKTLQELHRDKVDGAEFVRLRRAVEELKPLDQQRKKQANALKLRTEEREKLLVEWQEVRSAEFLALEKAAKKVSKQLRGQVKLKVNKDGDRSGLKGFLDEHLSGRRDQIVNAVEKEDFSISEFAKACLDGEAELSKRFGISASQAASLCRLALDVRLQIAEVEMAATTDIFLNVAAEGQPDEWNVLENLSKGQKATALLLLLLLQSTSPLIVDQPEDDLDNRFVSSGVVPRIRASKKNRQFLFATHNANIPVLGDAELIAALSASGEAGSGQGRLNPAQMGAIDTPAVKALVEELLEGGRSAFESRRRKYGY